MAAFTDDFTGTNDDLLEDRTGWTLTTYGGYRMTVFGNDITPRAGGGGAGYSLWTCTDQGSANHYTQVRDKTFYTSADGYWCCRLVDIDNFIGWYCPGSAQTGSRLMKMVATSITDLVSFQGADEDLIKVTCDGNSIEIYQDGGQVGTTQTVTDHNTETSQGTVQGVALGGYQMWDDFEAGPMAAGYTLECAAGSYAITGATLAPKHDKKIATTAGSYAVTGATLAPKHDKKIATTAGTYAVTGSTLAPIHAKKIATAAGTYAITGVAADVLHNKKIAITAGVYALTGAEATLTYSAGVTAIYGDGWHMFQLMSQN